MSPYAAYEVTPEPQPFWESVGWLDLEETLPGGWDADPLAGALPTVEMEDA